LANFWLNSHFWSLWLGVSQDLLVFIINGGQILPKVVLRGALGLENTNVSTDGRQRMALGLRFKVIVLSGVNVGLGIF
jgi:hypothetical protein